MYNISACLNNYNAHDLEDDKQLPRVVWIWVEPSFSGASADFREYLEDTHGTCPVRINCRWFLYIVFFQLIHSKKLLVVIKDKR